MKQHIRTLITAMAFFGLVGWMYAQSKKLHELTAATTLAGGDLLYTVRDPGGTPTDKKITVSDLKANVIFAQPIISGTTTPNVPLEGSNMELQGNGPTGLTITSVRDSALAGNLLLRHFRTNSNAQEYDRGGTIYFSNIDSTGNEQTSGTIYGSYLEDNESVIVLATNNTPDEQARFGGNGASDAPGGVGVGIGPYYDFPKAHVHVHCRFNTFHGMIVQGYQPQDVNLVEYRDWNEVVQGGIDKAGRPLLVGSAIPADGDVVTGQCILWFDATNGVGKVKYKGKTSDGTVVTGQF